MSRRYFTTNKLWQSYLTFKGRRGTVRLMTGYGNGQKMEGVFTEFDWHVFWVSFHCVPVCHKKIHVYCRRFFVPYSKWYQSLDLMEPEFWVWKEIVIYDKKCNSPRFFIWACICTSGSRLFKYLLRNYCLDYFSFNFISVLI